MGGKYTVAGKNYEDKFWEMYECTNSFLKAIWLYIKARKKCDYVELQVRKYD